MSFFLQMDNRCIKVSFVGKCKKWDDWACNLVNATEPIKVGGRYTLQVGGSGLKAALEDVIIHKIFASEGEAKEYNSSLRKRTKTIGSRIKRKYQPEREKGKKVVKAKKFKMEEKTTSTPRSIDLNDQVKAVKELRRKRLDVDKDIERINVDGNLSPVFNLSNSIEPLDVLYDHVSGSIPGGSIISDTDLLPSSRTIIPRDDTPDHHLGREMFKFNDGKTEHDSKVLDYILDCVHKNKALLEKQTLVINKNAELLNNCCTKLDQLLNLQNNSSTFDVSLQSIITGAYGHTSSTNKGNSSACSWSKEQVLGKSINDEDISGTQICKKSKENLYVLQNSSNIKDSRIYKDADISTINRDDLEELQSCDIEVENRDEDDGIYDRNMENSLNNRRIEESGEFLNPLHIPSEIIVNKPRKLFQAWKKDCKSRLLFAKLALSATFNHCEFANKSVSGIAKSFKKLDTKKIDFIKDLCFKKYPLDESELKAQNSESEIFEMMTKDLDSYLCKIRNRVKKTKELKDKTVKINTEKTEREGDST